MQPESIIYLAKEWDEPPTSCNHVFEQLVRHHKVLWVNSITVRNPNLASARDWGRIVRKVRRLFGGLRQVAAQGWVYQPLFIPLPYSKLAQKINRALLRLLLRWQARRLGMQRPQLWMFIPNGGFLIRELDESLVVYYCVDAWPEQSGGDGSSIAVMERELVEKADLCFATSESLVASKHQHNPNTFLALHGVDHEHFARALSPETVIPADVAALPHPIIGYFGLIYHLTDLDLIARIAQTHPEWSVVLIGKIQVDLGALRAMPNVHILGPRPYQALPEYCRAFDVGLLPYVDNEWIRHSNPIKMREYLSAGLPVVSIDIPEVRRYSQLVHVSGSSEEFITNIERALREDSPERRRARSEAMRGEGWEARVAQVWEQVMRIKAAKS